MGRGAHDVALAGRRLRGDRGRPACGRDAGLEESGPRWSAHVVVVGTHEAAGIAGAGAVVGSGALPGTARCVRGFGGIAVMLPRSGLRLRSTLDHRALGTCQKAVRA